VKKLVLIEDDPFFRLMMSDLLTLEGLDVTTAVDGVQALQRASDVQPDFILCHAKLPHLDGHAILKQMRENVSTAHIPFVLLEAQFYLDHACFASPLKRDGDRPLPVTKTGLLPLLMHQCAEC
jgi:CheY-like chemotaxis protein